MNYGTSEKGELWRYRKYPIKITALGKKKVTFLFF